MATLKNKRTKSQSQMILEYMQTRKKGINQIMAFNMYGCTRLAARIWDLKDAGHNVIKEMKKTPGGARIAQYSLKQSA